MSDLIDRNLIAELVDSHGNVHWEDIAGLPSEQPEVRTQMSSADCISRQAAIYAASVFGRPANIAKVLSNLPSAQPEVIRCNDCKHKHLENMVWTCPFGLPGGENFFCGYGAEPYKG